ncbi:MAG: hypothetical protein E7311_00545 [Clostridiales bacterium]|nr:hypothetical protein [Clostridiales bacterium]
MLAAVTKFFYKDDIYTDELDLFAQMYKLECGLYTFLIYRYIVLSMICTIFSVIFILFKFKIVGYLLLFIAYFFVLLEWLKKKNMEKVAEIEDKVGKGNFDYTLIKKRKHKDFIDRTHKITDFIRKIVVISGSKAVTRKEWKKIKKYDKWFYEELLSNESNHLCYYYSLELARILKDVTLVWGAVTDVFEEDMPLYAHAFIMKGEYIYDTNRRTTFKFEDYAKLCNFKIYKKWNYPEYSIDDFRSKNREGFANWCKQNNVKDYNRF